MTTRAACAAAAVALLLTGCAGGGDEGGGDSPSSSAAGESSSESQGDSEGDGPGSEGSELGRAAAEAGIDPKKPPKPLASVTMPAGANVENDEVADMTVDLISLKRQGELVVLTAAVTPDEKFDGSPMPYLGWTGSTWSPQIVDTTNLKVHDVVEAEGSKVMTGTGAVSADFGPGQTFYMYAVFAAPPEDVQTVTVKAADGAPAFTGVKIQ